MLKSDVEDFVLEAGESVWLPVIADPPVVACAGSQVVCSVDGSSLEVVPGLWEAGEDGGGLLLITNVAELDVDIANGSTAAGLLDAGVSVTSCQVCGGLDTSAQLPSRWCDSCGLPSADRSVEPTETGWSPTS